MKAKQGHSFLDCIWYITNLLKPFKDSKYNAEGCEKYFTFTTMLESPQLVDKNSSTEVVPTADLTENYISTETSTIFSTTFDWIEDSSLTTNYFAENQEPEINQTTNGTTTFDWIEDSTLTTNYFAENQESQINQTTNGSTYMRDISSFSFETEPVNITESTFDSSIVTDNPMSYESLHDYEMEESKTISSTTIDDITTFSTAFEDPISGLKENLTLKSSTTKGLMESLNLTTIIYDGTEDTTFFDWQDSDRLMEFPNITTISYEPIEDTTFLGLNDSDVLNRPDIVTVNRTLCQYYLPTIPQTPHALGNVGIALWVLGFVITFTLIVLSAKQTYFIYKTSHKVYRRHLYSITSIYVVIALLTSIGSGIPRAHAICSAVKDIYMAIGIGHFVDLTLAMYGGENIMAYYVKDKMINLRVIVVCKCCFCIPQCKVRRVSITVLKWIVWQMKWSQAFYYILKLIISKARENSLGITPHGGSYVWYLHIINVISFLSGVFSLFLIRSLVTDDLQQKYNYEIKAKLVRFTILTTKFQRLLFEILEATDVFPCYPPYVSKRYYKNVLKDFIYLVEVFILGVVTYIVYMKRGEFEHPSTFQIPQPMLEKENENPEENGDVEKEYVIPLDSNRLYELKESVC